jgi:hypothetical protein
MDRSLHPDFQDWQRGGLQIAWFDLDNDQNLDLVIRVRNSIGAVPWDVLIILISVMIPAV